MQYAEQLEHTVYNALLGAQDPRSGDICYFTPLNGKKSPGPGINCCVSSEPRGISMIPQLAWGARAGGVAVVFYAPGKVTVDGIRLDVQTNYPAEGSVALTVNPAKASRFPLFLRVPEWTARFTATTDGQTYQGAAGQFLAIEKEWKPGERVAIDMDLTVRVLPGGPSYPYNVAIARGPQVMALEQAVNPGVLDLQAAGPRAGEVKLADAGARLPGTWHGSQAYIVDGAVAGKPQQLTLVPFTDARVYRVWLLKP